MIDLILYNLSTSGGLMASFLIFVFVLGCIIYIYTKDFKIEGKKVKIYGLLLNMNTKNIFIVSLIVVRAFLIVYALIVYNQNIMYYIVMIGIVSGMLILISLKNIIYEILNTVALCTMVFFNYQISNYLIDVESTSSIIIVKTILMSFGVLYTIYLFLKEFEDITARHENIN